jgi:hypothetical protein
MFRLQRAPLRCAPGCGILHSLISSLALEIALTLHYGQVPEPATFACLLPCFVAGIACLHHGPRGIGFWVTQ